MVLYGDIRGGVRVVIKEWRAREVDNVIDVV